MTAIVAPRNNAQAIKSEPNWGNIWFLVSITVGGLLAIAYAVVVSPTAWHWWFALGLFVYTILGVTVDYHRHATHGSFKMARPILMFWRIGASLALQGYILKWVGDHRIHHAFTDRPDLDPHTPYQFGRPAPLRQQSAERLDWLRHPWQHEYVHQTAAGPLYMTLGELWRGFWWAHMIWICFKRDRPTEYKIADLLGEQVMVDGQPLRDEQGQIVRQRNFNAWQADHYWVFVVGSFALPALVGVIAGASGGWSGAIREGITALMIAGVLRVFVSLHSAWMTNSVCHMIGSKTKDSLGRKFNGDDSRNVWWLFWLLLGENWHNLHHRFPRAFGHGWKWYHPDLTKWMVLVLEVPERLRQGLDWLSAWARLPGPVQLVCGRLAWICERCRLVWDVQRVPKYFVHRDDQLLPSERETAA